MQKFEITFKGSTKTYEVPSTWLDITVNTFIDVYKLQQTFNEGDSQLSNLIKMFSLLINIEEEVLMNMDVAIFTQLKETIGFLYDSSDLSKVITTEKIRHKDKVLYVNTKFDKLTVQDMITIEGINKNQTDLVLSMVPLLAYLIKEKNEEGELVKTTVDCGELRIIDVYSLIMVFSNGVAN